MEKNDRADLNFGRELLSWKIPAYQPHERSSWWYLAFFGIAGILLILSFFTPNFLYDKPNYLFATIIVLISFVFIYNANKLPPVIDIVITTEGLVIGESYYSYDTFKDFCVIFKPNEGVKTLYLEYKNPVKPRLSVPLIEANPLEVRETLLKYLMEDLDRVDESNTDFLSTRLKI